MNSRFNIPHNTFTTLLLLLTLLFVFRVAAQFVQLVFPMSWLPAFDRWQGSTTPYGLLLVIQMVIIAAMVKVSRDHHRGAVARKIRKGRWILITGVLYFSAMAIRFTAGLSGLSTLPWFQKVIPAFFHLVLASFILLLGAYHTGNVADIRQESL